jgi:hypothetical protein
MAKGGTMANVMMIIGNANMKPGASTPEQAASEYFHNAATMGSYALKPPVHKWNKDQRERFEKELERLEAERLRQRDEAREFAAKMQ